MRSFLSTLHQRNKYLSIFGWACVVAALLCLALMAVTNTQVLGINAWIKPFKFMVSSTVFCWTMGWICYYLNAPKKVNWYSWVVIIVLGFENIYISLQAAKGQLSHFNISGYNASIMFSLMGVAITILTLWTAYIGFLFFKKSFPQLSPSYLLGIRLGLIFFVVFAFEGGIMASLLRHTIAAPDGGPGLPLINWSTRAGDLRVAHFLGMHALQLLPFLGHYVVKNKAALLTTAAAYLVLIVSMLVEALNGVPLIAR